MPKSNWYISLCALSVRHVSASMIWVYTDLYQCTIFFPFHGDWKQLSRISMVCLSFETIFSTFSYPQPFWRCLFFSNFFTILCNVGFSLNWPTEAWKSQRDVLMLLSLVLHCYSKRWLFFWGLTVLEQYFRSKRKRNLCFIHFNKHQIWEFSTFYLTISSKAFLCLLPIWLWAFLWKTVYLHVLNTFVVVIKESAYLQRLWGREQ